VSFQFTNAVCPIKYLYGIQVQVFWVVMLCSAAVGYQGFGGLCLHLQGEVTVMGKNGIGTGPEWGG